MWFILILTLQTVGSFPPPLLLRGLTRDLKVFFDEYDTNEHSSIPTLKLGDFGLAKKMNARLLHDL